MELAQKLLSCLFPSRCILCQRTLTGHMSDGRLEICSACLYELPHNHCCCPRCALPLPEDASAGVLCGRCIKKTPLFDYAYSLFRYEDEVVSLVHQLKFAEKITYSRSLGEMLYSLLEEQLKEIESSLMVNKPDCLLPVPLHNSRLRQRGYNQSIEIARVMAKKLDIPIAYEVVIRRRRTSAQTGLHARQRLKNIRGAFEVVADVKNKHLLIIDDVMTTGATVNELAKVLKKQHAARVGVLSIARAPIKS